ncbi:MAG TPA: hypothetical protein VGF71_06995 [Caulobacteraceae bacterium]
MSAAAALAAIVLSGLVMGAGEDPKIRLNLQSGNPIYPVTELGKSVITKHVRVVDDPKQINSFSVTFAQFQHIVGANAVKHEDHFRDFLSGAHICSKSVGNDIFEFIKYGLISSVGIPQTQPQSCAHIAGRRFAKILNDRTGYTMGASVFLAPEKPWNDRNIRSQFFLGRLFSVIKGGGGGVGRSIGFISGPLSLSQGSIDQIDADGGNGRLSYSGNKQPHRPESSVLRGLSGFASVFLCGGGLLVSVLGFKRGGDALGVAMDRGGWTWVRFLAWFPVALGGCWFFAGVVVYWIAQAAP